MKAHIGMKRVNEQKGMSLVELMIALLIGLLLSGAIVTVYISNKKTYWDSEAAAALQENSRFAMKLIANDLRMAGYYGNVDHKNIENKLSATIADGDSCKMPGSTTRSEYQYDISVWVVPANSASPNCKPANVLPGSDILFVKHAAKESSNGTSTDKTYIVSGLVDSAAHYVGASDLANKVAPSGEYPDGEIREYLYYAYYISKVKDEVFPQLRRRTFGYVSGSPDWYTETVADGIEDIYFKFGLDTDTNPDGFADTYVDAATINLEASLDWSQVIAAKIYLLAQSTKSDLTFTDEKAYRYRDANAAPLGGHYHRKLLETTVTFFNNQMERVRGL